MVGEMVENIFDSGCVTDVCAEPFDDMPNCRPRMRVFLEWHIGQLDSHAFGQSANQRQIGFKASSGAEKPNLLSGASVPWPRGRGRACAQRPIPSPFWCAMTRQMVPRPCRLVRRRAGRGRVARRPICWRHVPDLVRQDGRQVWAPRAPSPLATFAHVRRPGDRRRRGPSPGQARREPGPGRLTIPERGLYTGVAMFGAAESGKTSACMHPFARQLLSWHANNPERRLAALVLEVKGDFCHDIRRMHAGVTFPWP